MPLRRQKRCNEPSIKCLSTKRKSSKKSWSKCRQKWPQSRNWQGVTRRRWKWASRARWSYLWRKGWKWSSRWPLNRIWTLTKRACPQLALNQRTTSQTEKRKLKLEASIRHSSSWESTLSRNKRGTSRRLSHCDACTTWGAKTQTWSLSCKISRPIGLMGKQGLQERKEDEVWAAKIALAKLWRGRC